MVRLEAANSFCKCSCNKYFNSTMVRLEGYFFALGFGSQRYFNSTMVRLEVTFYLPFFVGVAFQFHYGTIRREFQGEGELFLGNFNSTMVRLEAETETSQFKIEIFQFHYGTIRSKAESIRLASNDISIPLWYD